MIRILQATVVSLFGIIGMLNIFVTFSLTQKTFIIYANGSQLDVNDTHVKFSIIHRKPSSYTRLL